MIVIEKLSSLPIASAISSNVCNKVGAPLVSVCIADSLVSILVLLTAIWSKLAGVAPVPWLKELSLFWIAFDN